MEKIKKEMQRRLESEEKSSRYLDETKRSQVKVIIITKQSTRCLKSGVENRLEADTGPRQ